jgi:uncharacterized phage protein (TIGR02216 family)
MSWTPLIRHAARDLHIPPAAFWRLSLKEWRALVSEAEAPLGRAGLEALLENYPDEKDQ